MPDNQRLLHIDEEKKAASKQFTERYKSTKTAASCTCEFYASNFTVCAR